MSENKKLNTETGEVIAAKKSFCYRGIKKEFTEFDDTQVVTRECHLELGENNESIIVDDRNTDWLELANKDVKSVGLRHVLENLARQGMSVNDVIRNKSYAFSDDEAIDTSMIDPNDPASISRLAEKTKESQSKLESIAGQLGLSVDELVKAYVEGKLNDLIAAKSDTGEGGNS